jgi:hypothetical protein
MIDRFEDAGGTQGMYVLSEIQREQLAPILDEIEATTRAAGESGGMVGVSGALHLMLQGHWRQALDAVRQSLPARGALKATRAMMDLYEAEDKVFRLAAFMRALDQGKSVAEAGKFARKSFLDYQINAPWIQIARQTALPFVSFTYRALPMLANTAMTKPWKILKMATVFGLANALAYALGTGGGDEDDERKLLPEEKAGWLLGVLAPKLIRMPWNDANDAPVFLDVRRFIPLGDIVDFGQSHSALPVPGPLVPGGPIELLAELFLNRSAFTGREIVKGTDTALEQAGKITEYLWKALAPNMPGVPGTYGTDRIMHAAMGETDRAGNERSLAYAALNSIGIKLDSYPPAVLAANERGRIRSEMDEIGKGDYDLRRQAARHDINEEQLRRGLERSNEKRQTILNEYRRKIGGGLPSD